MAEQQDEHGAPDAPPTFDAAVRSAVAELGETLKRFEALYESLPPDAFDDAEWEQIERASRDLEEMVARGEDAYVAVEFDSRAWYTVVHQLQQVTRRLGEAVVLMEAVRQRRQAGP